MLCLKVYYQQTMGEDTSETCLVFINFSYFNKMKWNLEQSIYV